MFTRDPFVTPQHRLGHRFGISLYTVVVLVLVVIVVVVVAVVVLVVVVLVVVAVAVAVAGAAAAAAGAVAVAVAVAVVVVVVAFVIVIVQVHKRGKFQVHKRVLALCCSLFSSMNPFSVERPNQQCLTIKLWSNTPGGHQPMIAHLRLVPP